LISSMTELQRCLSLTLV